MSKFLATIKKKVIDQAYQPAVPEVPAVLDGDGNEITPAIPAVPEVPEVSHEEIGRCYVEDSAEQVAKIMAMQAADPLAYPNLTFYSLNFNGATLRPTVRSVRERGRTAAPAKEIVTIEDQDGNELGSAEI